MRSISNRSPLSWSFRRRSRECKTSPSKHLYLIQIPPWALTKIIWGLRNRLESIECQKSKNFWKKSDIRVVNQRWKTNINLSTRNPRWTLTAKKIERSTTDWVRVRFTKKCKVQLISAKFLSKKVKTWCCMDSLRLQISFMPIAVNNRALYKNIKVVF